MPRLLPLLLSLFTLLAWSAPAHAIERLAVLELTGKSLSTDERATLTDTVRGAVVEALGDRVAVMTRENMEVMMTDMGLDAACVSEGACEVETARNLGVDYVISGSVTSMSGVQVASLKLLETRTGQMISSKQVKGADALELMDGLAEPSRTLVGSLATAAAPAAAAAGKPTPVAVAEAKPMPVAATPMELLSLLKAAGPAPKSKSPMNCAAIMLGLWTAKLSPSDTAAKITDQGDIYSDEEVAWLERAGAPAEVMTAVKQSGR